MALLEKRMFDIRPMRQNEANDDCHKCYSIINNVKYFQYIRNAKRTNIINNQLYLKELNTSDIIKNEITVINLTSFAYFLHTTSLPQEYKLTASFSL